MPKKIFLYALVIGLLALGAGIFVYSKNIKTKQDLVNSWKNVISKNQNNVTSSPSTSLPQSGQEPVINTTRTKPDMSNLIRVTSVTSGQLISSPVVVEGEARGSWFFEGQFPVQIVGEDGKILGKTIAQAKGEWMTEEFVPFIATIDFETPLFVNGTLVLQKDNPSGLPQNDASLEISVVFSQKAVERVSGGCKITGCSSELCSEGEVMTNCAYKEEFLCYQKAKCEPQQNGKCGWAQTKELSLCLGQFTLD